MGKEFGKKKLFIFGLVVIVVLAVFVLAVTIDSVTLYAPGNNTATDDTTPDFNFSCSGSESNYSSELYMCDEDYNLLSFNTSGNLIETVACSGSCGFSCVCDAAQQAYKTYDCGGDTVYVNCANNKCWTPSANIPTGGALGTLVWDASGVDEGDNSCIGKGAGYPACNYCDSLTYGGFTDWILPIKDDLSALCNSASCSGTCFGGEGLTSYYWSSTENSAAAAWTVRFSDCLMVSISKGSAYRVRCSRG